MTHEPVSQAARGFTSGDSLRRRVARWWSPRQSLSARLLFTFLPIAVLAAALYWILADRYFERSERELTSILVADATERERVHLGQTADSRVRDIVEQSSRVKAVLAGAAEEAARALEAGPSAGLPAETVVDEPGGPIRTSGSGRSSALVSRAYGLTPRTRRDIATTRRLERPFAALALGHPDIRAAFVITASGVVRVVPAENMERFLKTSGLKADFRVPSRFAAPLLNDSKVTSGLPVTWTDVYEDADGGKRSMVSVFTLARSRTGAILGEVGVDWAFPDLFTRLPEPRRAGEVELLAMQNGKVGYEDPSGRLPAVFREQIGVASRRHDFQDLQISVRGEPYLVSLRKVPELPWDYIRVVPQAAIRRQVDAQVKPIFEAGRTKRRELRLLYLVAMIAIAVALVAVTRRTVGPIRDLARLADAITAGRPAPELDGFDRPDEVGRLSRAMRNLDQRMRRRIWSMEGVHQLAQTASVMTRAEETHARLTRQIAEMVGATKSWFWIWEPESRTLVLTPPGHGVADERLRGQRLGLQDRGLAIQCYRTGETCLQNDIHSDPRVSMTLVEAIGIEKSIVFVPLKTEVGILGVLAVADKPGGFDAEDQAAIEGWADEAALLLRNTRLYEELQKSYERLRDAQRNRDYFLQNINHELRTPLTAILGWSEVLAEDRPDAETVKTAMEQIHRSAQFLLALISDLLDLSRFDEGRTKLEPEDVDLATLIQEAVEPVSIMAEGKGIAVSVTAPAPGKATVYLDPMRMRQVLWNLVHNAVKFTNRGGRIDVKAYDGDQAVSFVVADNGVGIDPKDLPFIFERFRQVDGSTTRAYRGMGIGLALAKSYVELHGGTIGVESQPGRGTRFTIEIPKRSASASSGAAASSGDAEGAAPKGARST